MTNAPDVMKRAIDGFAALNLIAEATAGYHRKLVDGGIGKESADEMAKEYHSILLGVMAKKIGAA